MLSRKTRRGLNRKVLLWAQTGVRYLLNSSTFASYVISTCFWQRPHLYCDTDRNQLPPLVEHMTTMWTAAANDNVS
jgi:hypothetical protein